MNESESESYMKHNMYNKKCKDHLNLDFSSHGGMLQIQKKHTYNIYI